MTRARRVLAACLLAGLLSACRGGPAEKSEAPPSPRVELEGAHLVESAGGQKVWELDAKRAVYRNEAGIATLYQVSTRFYENNRVVSHGRAPLAIFHLGDRRLELSQGIHFESADAQSGFAARRVVWLPSSGRLSAEGDVTFWRGAYHLASGALTADRALRQVQLMGGVKGRGPLTGSGTPALQLPSTLLAPPRSTP